MTTFPNTNFLKRLLLAWRIVRNQGVVFKTLFTPSGAAFLQMAQQDTVVVGCVFDNTKTDEVEKKCLIAMNRLQAEAMGVSVSTSGGGA